jgi:hypothetical protein
MAIPFAARIVYGVNYSSISRVLLDVNGLAMNDLQESAGCICGQVKA